MKTRFPAVLLILPFLLVFFCGSSVAQWPDQCVDSTKVNPFFPSCGPEYIPVCGCDNITYRNYCSAVNIGGVTGTITNGVCSEFEFDIIPTFLTNSSGYLKLSIVFKDRGSAIIQIMDLYGKLEYTYSIPERQDFSIEFDPSHFRHGLHFVAVISNGERKVKRFIKIPEN